MEFKILEEKINYSFKDPSLLSLALTHSSRGEVNESGERMDNERLEFLGDAFLDAIVGEELYIKSDYAEGRLTKLRSQVVSEKALAGIGRGLDVPRYLRLGEGEEANGVGEQDSVIADSVEALIGAIYLDGGFPEVKRVTLGLTKKLIEDALSGKLFNDYKSRLQELVQKQYGNDRIIYEVELEEGPDHDKTFYVAVKVNGLVRGRGKGNSKKEAEFNAARMALEMEE